MSAPKKEHPQVRRSLSLPPWVDKWLVEEAEREGLSVSKLVVHVIACYRGERAIEGNHREYLESANLHNTDYSTGK